MYKLWKILRLCAVSTICRLGIRNLAQDIVVKFLTRPPKWAKTFFVANTEQIGLFFAIALFSPGMAMCCFSMVLKLVTRRDDAPFFAGVGDENH